MNKERYAVIALLVVTAIWGATFVVVQHAVSFVQPFTFLAIRFFIGGTLLVLIQLLMKKKFGFQSNAILPGILIGFALFFGYVFQTYGLLYTTSSKSGFITGLCVVIVPVLAFLFLKQQTPFIGVIGIISATVGLFFLTGGDLSSINLGDVLTLGCAICFAVHILLMGRFAGMYDPLSIATVQIMTVSICSGIGALFFEDYKRALEPTLWSNSSFLAALLITAILATSFGYVTQTVAQKYVVPSKVALILLMEPVFATLTGVTFAGDVLTISTFIGCLLILVGMLFVELPGMFAKRKKRERAQS